MNPGLVTMQIGAERLVGRPFARMNGVGNAILVLDLRGSDIVVTGAEARARAGEPRLAFDQLMVIHDPRDSGTDAFLAIYNNDGSVAGACGNGTRCVAWFMLRDSTRDSVVVTTSTARLACHRLGQWRFSVDMGVPTFDPASIPVRAADPAAVEIDLPEDPMLGRAFALGMGNPHAIFFVPDADAIDIARVGPLVEHAAAFPDRANVSFAQVIDPGTIKLRVWERGAGATLGCGSGACATLVAAATTGRTGRTAHVDLPGGRLEIAWRDDDHVVLTGPVELEFEGVFAPHRVADSVA